MIKFFEKRRVLAILLALTLFSTIFSSLSMINPMATEDIKYDTKVVHVKRSETLYTSGRTIWVKVANAADIKADETYTVKVAQTGSVRVTGTSTVRKLAVRVDTDFIDTETTEAANLRISNEYGTVDVGYAATQWTVNITPISSKDLYVGMYTNYSDNKNAEFYLGGVHVIDKDGNDVAIPLSTSPEFRTCPNPNNGMGDAGNTATYFETAEVVNVDDVTNAETKQSLINAFYEGKSMLNLTVGTENNHYAIYKKVPAGSLVAGTKYKLSVKYAGLELSGNNCILIRSGADKGSDKVISSDTSTTGEFIKQGTYTEYVDYYTVPSAPTDLYIGLYLTKDTWAAANVDLGDIKFSDANGKNVVTPLSDMGDIYGSYDGGAIIELLPSAATYDLVTIKKLKYNADKFTNTLYNTKVVHIARGNAEKKDTLRYAYFNIADAADIVAGETYTVKMTYMGTPTMTASATSRYLAIRQGGKGSGAVALAKCNENGTLNVGYNATEWTVDVTPTEAKNLYVCVYIGASYTTADFYLGGVHVIDKDGNDVSVALSDDTDLYNNASVTNTNFYNKTSGTPITNYFETAEVVNVDDVADAELKQTLVNAFYEGDSMLNLTAGTENNHYAIYKKVPASSLVAGAKYKLSVKYSGVEFSGSDCILVRSGADKGSDEVISSETSTTGKFTEYENYSEYVDYYTVPSTPTDLYIGLYLTKNTWATANFYIDAIGFTDASGKNVVTPLSDMGDIYSSFSGGAIGKFNSSNANYSLVTINKLIYNENKSTSSEEPTEDNTKVVHIARGNAEKNTTARGIYFKIADASDIVGGETYTVTMTYTGTTLTPTKATRFVGIRETKNNYVKSYESGTETEENGATTWTVDFTPTASKDLYGCLYTNSECAATDAYIGGIKVVDKNGKDVAIDLSEITDFYNNAGITNSNLFSSTDATNPISKYYETAEVITINQITNENVKKTLKYALLGIEEQEPPAILKYSVGPINQSHMVYKKVSANKLVAGTRYKLSVKYSGINFGKSEYIIVRDNVAKDTPSVLESRNSTSGEFLEHTNYMEYVDYITVPDTPKDLYIGFYLRKSVWETANVYVGAITLTDMNGNNAVTSLGDTTDLYGSFWGNTIKKMDDGPSTYVKVEKLPFDETMFPNDGITVPDYMLYAEHNSTSDDSLVVEIPADKLVVGKEYTVQFSSNMLTAEFDEDVCFGIFGGPGEGGKTWSEIVYGSALVGGDFATSETDGNVRRYTFTLSEKKFDKYYVGFYIAGSDRTIKFYMSGLTIYESDAKVKENLIPDDGASMVNWHSNTETGTSTGLGASSFVMYERSNLELTDENFKHKTMLYFERETTKQIKHCLPVKTNELLPNTDYVVTLKYKNLAEGEEGIGIGLRIYADEGYTCDEKGNPTNPNVPKPANNSLASASNSGTNVWDLHKDSGNVYFVVRFSENQLVTYKNIYVGFYLNGYTNVYITDLVMYRKSDTNKVNVLAKDNYSTDMLGWVQDTRAALAKEADKFFGTHYVKYDGTQFLKEYNITGSYNKGDRIAYKLDKSQLTAGKEYEISLEYNFGSKLTLDKEISMTVFGDTDSTDKVYADTVIVNKFSNVESGKSDRSYTFKVTQEMLDKYDDIYIGFNFNEKVENIDINFVNLTLKDFDSGIVVYAQDKYSSKVTGWYTANEKLGTTQMSHNFKTQLYYGVQYPKYKFDEIDNGEWWNAEDVKPLDKNYNNTINGIVIGVDGKPVKNAKIQLISGTNTYDVVTDSKGAFSLTNIVPGYYQLYWVDKDGNLISFEYGIDIARDTLITLNVKVNNVYDTTVEENVEDAVGLGSIRGNVYTPQLKVVKGIKIYLGDLGYVVTDENGYFEFVNAPVGEYKLFTILENGKEYVFKTVEIKKDVEISTKLKYDPQIAADADASQNIVWIIILIVAIVVMLGAGVTIILIAAKNKKKQ